MMLGLSLSLVNVVVNKRAAPELVDDGTAEPTLFFFHIPEVRDLIGKLDFGSASQSHHLLTIGIF